MLRCSQGTFPHLPSAQQGDAAVQLYTGPQLSSGSIPFTGHYSLHFDAFHHPLGDTPPALPARTLRKVMY